MLKAHKVYPGIADEVLEYTKEERTPGQVDYLKELKTHIRTYSKICPERARYWTQGYKESDGEPEVIRVANAVACVLDNMTIYIEPGELIEYFNGHMSTIWPAQNIPDLLHVVVVRGQTCRCQP